SSEDKDALTVGVSADNPPYEFIKDGKIEGLDLDVIEAIGKVLGRKIVIKNLDFPGLFPALSSGSVDCVISGISVTESRKEHFDFSENYAGAPMAVLFRKDDKFAKTENLEGKVIGAQLGTTWDIEAKKISSKLTGVLVRSLSNNLVLVEELKSGSVDAVVLEKMQVAEFIKNNPGLDFFDIPESSSNFAIVVNKGSKLLTEINKAIAKLNEEKKLQAIKDKWIK
ncbi:MAG: amino acid ABC transporter substrate-binding protein, partial [Rickettsiaceae bacterium]|nr:amino acid ABC transporter substrate-binding protein [Rickettsiaceae bacterium]